MAAAHGELHGHSGALFAAALSWDCRESSARTNNSE
jgi:hypothetical protein